MDTNLIIKIIIVISIIYLYNSYYSNNFEYLNNDNELNDNDIEYINKLSHDLFNKKEIEFKDIEFLPNGGFVGDINMAGGKSVRCTNLVVHDQIDTSRTYILNNRPWTNKNDRTQTAELGTDRTKIYGAMRFLPTNRTHGKSHGQLWADNRSDLKLRNNGGWSNVW